MNKEHHYSIAGLVDEPKVEAKTQMTCPFWPGQDCSNTMLEHASTPVPYLFEGAHPRTTVYSCVKFVGCAHSEAKRAKIATLNRTGLSTLSVCCNFVCQHSVADT